jgi:hypothetical protein
MGAVQTYEEKPTFETVWAALQETDRLSKETYLQMQETDRLSKETYLQMQDTDRRMKRTERMIKNTDKTVGKLGNRLCEIIEYMVMPNLLIKFRELGFVFNKAYPHATIEDEANNTCTEIDITLENGDKVMIVEVKTKPTTEDIIDHVDRMGKVRVHGDLHGDRRVFLGAVAGMVFNTNEKEFAMKNGFYVVEPSGKTFVITVPAGSYSPREW